MASLSDQDGTAPGPTSRGGRGYIRPMNVVAIVLGGGRGTRLGAAEPKALVRILGRTLLAWSAQALADASSVDGVLPVLPAADLGAASELEGGWKGPARLLPTVAGGETRQLSLARGLDTARRLAPALEWVLIHDAARPFVEPEDAERVLRAARTTGAALPVLPLGDTLKEIRGDRVARTPSRESFALAQTPQAFRVSLLWEALEKARAAGFEATDCSGLVEWNGGEVRTCLGRVENFKVTTAADLARARAWAESAGASV